MPRITLATLLSAPPPECFSLSLSVEAHLSSMADAGERAVAGVTSGTMGLGDTVTWRARHFGVWFTLTSVINQYDAPHRFVDEQTAGPFRRWWHEHRFEPVAGGTRMIDVVEFDSPAGPLGHAVNALGLTRYMTGLLEQRNRWLIDSLGPLRS